MSQACCTAGQTGSRQHDSPPVSNIDTYGNVDLIWQWAVLAYFLWLYVLRVILLPCKSDMHQRQEGRLFLRNGLQGNPYAAGIPLAAELAWSIWMLVEMGAGMVPWRVGREDTVRLCCAAPTH